MECQSGLSELSVISWVSAIQGCPLSGVPLYSLILSLCGLHGYEAKANIDCGVHRAFHVARVFFFFPTGLDSMHLLYQGQRGMATFLQLCTRDRNTF